ncbi:ABC transporter permease [Marinimicrobium sp. ABcell2]|uniref:ABC transporter permease n=1 Tax=Marinimicrobium sp. ABcell2 TaxID=3069751 RepID=UPI0027B482AE|nr:FtsX-like permease family protein [Marinimicrobium sp. ABcell2]MDQ2077321.1 FtsX-like permease family protein [Marinimicrobium sp. ABcell2]
MLALRLLWRNWRSGEVKLLAVALVLAVAVVSGIAIFADRLDTTLVQQSNAFLGADLIVSGTQPHRQAWSEEAENRGIEQTRVVEFSSMVFSGDELHLASIRAVAEGYPLRGYVETSHEAYSQQPPVRADSIPPAGEVWVDGRLLPLLNIELGDDIEVGEHTLTTTRILVRQPGESGFAMTGARVLMNLADLEQTQVVQPGSRIDYQWLVASDDSGNLAAFREWLQERLTDHDRIRDIDSSQRQLAQTLETGERFLLLAAVVGVLLAGVAIGLAARQFAARHVDQVALMKSLGAGAGRIRQLYAGQLLILATLASLVGLVLGEGIQRGVASSLQSFFNVALAAPAIYAYVLSFFSGLVCLMFFALPALWFLPQVPPLKILRRELAVNQTQLWIQVVLALAAIFLLVSLFSRQLGLSLSVMAALTGILVMSAGIGFVLLKFSRRLSTNAGSIWRLAVANLQRQRGQSLVQMVIFSIAIMLLLTLTAVRTSLIEDWRMQLPENAPNHFLVNIAPQNVEAVQSFLDQEGVDREPLYPMVLGRLTHINGEERDRSLGMNREANLTWTDTLGDDNEIQAGAWWDEWSSETGLPGVSVEEGLAEQLGLSVGTRLEFSLGGLPIEVEVASLRSLDWQSMNPNFFFIFEPGALDDFSATYITSAYLPNDKKPLINELLRAYPNILVIELDRVFEQIRSIVDQVSQGVQLVLWLTLLGGGLVLFAAVTSSIDGRKREAGLLRALGSPRRLVIGSIWAEFSILGFLAGLVGVIGAEILLWNLQYWVLDIPVRAHPTFWVLGPILGAVCVGTLGAISCRGVVTTPPAVVLREAG